MPPIKPDVTQERLFGGRCACCQARVTASAPTGLEQGSPFGQSIAAMVVYLHYALDIDRLDSAGALLKEPILAGLHSAAALSSTISSFATRMLPRGDTALGVR